MRYWYTAHVTGFKGVGSAGVRCSNIIKQSWSVYSPRVNYTKLFPIIEAKGGQGTSVDQQVDKEGTQRITYEDYNNCIINDSSYKSQSKGRYFFRFRDRLIDTFSGLFPLTRTPCKGLLVHVQSNSHWKCHVKTKQWAWPQDHNKAQQVKM